MRKRNSFMEQLRRKQQAARTAPQKPVSEMTEAELDAEETRLQEELRRIRESEVAAQREAQQGGSSKFMLADLVRRRRRPYWK
jgi:hypothetical protein